MAAFLQTNATIDANERAYAYLCDWIAMNSNRFCTSSQEVYGSIDNGWAYIVRGVFNQVIEDAGFSAKGFLGWLKRKGHIDTRGRALTQCKRIGGVRTECVIFQLPLDPDENPYAKDKADESLPF